MKRTFGSLKKVALAQINVTIGDFRGGISKIRDLVDRAKKEKAQLVVFPELTLTGYPPRDLLEIPKFVDRNLQALREVAQMARGIDIVVGFVDRNPRVGGKPLFNAAALCQRGRVAHRYHKNLLPTYDVFDEGRYFEPGKKTGVWKICGCPVGILICEDTWNDKLFWQRCLYSHDPVEEVAKKGARILLSISASPFSLGKPELRRKMLKAHARKWHLPILSVNLVGGNDELVFDGRSLVVNSGGELVGEAKAFDEDLLIIDVEQLGDRQHKGTVLKFVDDEMEDVRRALVLGVRDYVRKCGFEKVVLGLSGGIDSSLVAVIAAEAVGPENVLGVCMPSPYTSVESREDALQLARGLGIAFEEYPITEIYEAYRSLFHRGGAPDLADENIQARIRGNILMALSNRKGYLVLSTGNKSELAVGYCTLYGDMSGGLAVIADLPKMMVYSLARSIQKRRQVIPERVFTKPPSAELRPHQTDQESLPPYTILDGILKAVIEENKVEEEVVGMGFPRAVVNEVVGKIEGSEYKRRQAVPGIKVTSKAFGIGRRYPIARKIGPS